MDIHRAIEIWYWSHDVVLFIFLTLLTYLPKLVFIVWLVDEIEHLSSELKHAFHIIAGYHVHTFKRYKNKNIRIRIFIVQ
jgi:hypothetical protein